MGHESRPEFLTLHALRIKGFAPVPTLAGIAALPAADVGQHLSVFERDGHVEYREARGLWQLRDGQPNDHADDPYDRDVVARLDALHSHVTPIVEAMAGVLRRLGPYAPRLDGVRRRLVVDGEELMFTGVMCGSYHDVWMELHEDLIVNQGIDRAAEGSF